MKITIFFTLFLLILFPSPIFAQENNLTTNQFVTLVNPVRISNYSIDPEASLSTQYWQVQKRGLSATWLFNYDVISNPGIVSVAKKMDKSQEFGLLLEITPFFSSEAGVVYNKTDSWHRANSVFLSGYTQEERVKLIDKAFEKFKQIFYVYPTSVGAWWIDSYSLEYMKKKYGITSNLTVADQFSTDGYQVWGQPWSIPFYPSKIHTGMPAQTLDSKLDVVTIQWAARDPLNGYGRGSASLFSTQDYFKIEYFQKLVDLYAKDHDNKFGQITVGLEGDFPPQSYNGFFADQLDVINAKTQLGSLQVVTMRDFSSWYRDNFPKLSPVQIIQTDDLLGEGIKTIWYQSPSYRINITYNYKTRKVKVRDFRTYHNDFQEPYYISPDRDLDLAINLPSQIDSANNPDEEWTIFTDELLGIESSDEKITLKFKMHKIKLNKEEISIVGVIKNVPNLVVKSPLISVKKTGNELDLLPKTSWIFPPGGLIFRSLTPEGTFFLKQRKVILSGFFIILSAWSLVLFIFRWKRPLFHKIIMAGSILLLIIGGSTRWYLLNSRLYFVNQSELDALNRLRLMPGKKIVIYDKICLQCSWHTMYMPAVFANKRAYVSEVTGKSIVYNSSIFNAKTRPDAKREVDKLNADYIYLVKFEDYGESPPFSPGDLNIEKIYENANAVIWRIKKS